MMSVMSMVTFMSGIDVQAHRPQVDRDKGCVCDEVPIGCEEGAREIESFFDVGANGCLLE